LNSLVSVVCLCYNHRRFLREAVVSVVNQTYPSLQIILVDDASTDDSKEEISRLKEEYPLLEIVLNQKNLGNCRAFNQALQLVKGDFVIDFSTDDVMLPDRIQRQVEFFSSLDSSYGVVFTDATYIDAAGKLLRGHFEYLLRKKLISAIPKGDVYRHVLASYFIPGPTTMVRRAVFDTLQGYDESLAYEDFDFWVRSSRIYHYAYLDYRSTLIRKVAGSMSTGWYVPGDAQLHSTYLICRKAQQLNRNPEDHVALIHRVRYEFRQSVTSGNYNEARDFYSLLKELNGVRLTERLLWLAAVLRVPLGLLRRVYHRFRYN
jgi:glycosyltransferase involved in cell wall biosynthesis